MDKQSPAAGDCAVPPIPNPSPARGEGSKIESLVTRHLDIWTSAIETRSTAGRGSSNKLNLYGIKKLRELILELAVRGQLVVQDPEDEPASVLLEKIAAEKARLIKDGKLKKQKSLPLIADNERLFELPDGWELARLGDVFDVRDGTHDSPKAQTHGFPLITSKNLSSGVLDFTDVNYISAEDHKKIIERSKVDRDDILFAMIGSIGNPVIVDVDSAFSIKNVALFKYYKREFSSPLYLKIFLTLASVSMKEESSGGVQSFVSLGKLRAFVINLPPLAEQHRIVAKVNELMSLCDALEQEQAANIAAHQTLVEELLAALTSSTPNSPPSLTLPPQGVEGTREKNRAALLLPSPLAGEGLGMGGMPAWERIATHFDTLFTTEHSIDQLKQTILQLAVMGKLVPQDPNDEPASVLLQKIVAEKARLVKAGKIKKEKPLPPITDDEKPFELPQGWEWCRVWDVAELITSGSRDWAKYYSDSGAIFVTMGNLSRGDYKLRMDSIRYVRPTSDGEGLRTKLAEGDLLISITGDVGNLGLIPKDFGEAYINQHTCLLRFMPDCRSRYFPELMRSPLAKYQFDAPQRGIKNSFRLGDVGEMIIPLPPLAEQPRIVAKIDALMALCDQLNARISAAQTTQLHLADTLAMQVTGEE